MVRDTKSTKSSSKILVGDARKLRFDDEFFDAIVFLGAAISDFSIAEFLLVARETFRVLNPKGLMISSISDHVRMLFSGNYQHVLYQPGKEDDDAISIHMQYDGEKGTFSRLFFDMDRNKKFRTEFCIWAPWIYRHVMDEAGFKLKTSEPNYLGNLCLDVHQKP